MSWYAGGLKFDCQRCGNCCSGKGSFVRVSDREVDALAAETGLSSDAFRASHTTAAHEATVLKDQGGDGDCEWLLRNPDGTSGCRVQNAKPDQCRTYPFWPRVLRRKAAWDAEAVGCKGIGQGDIVPAAEIDRQSGLEQVFEDLDELCVDLGMEVEGIGVTCWLKGKCCDFPTAGHRLYASRIEAERFAAGVDLADWDPDSGLCPAWKDGKCNARSGRPTGCRTYYCDPEFEDATQDLAERYITRLKWLHDKHDRPWEYRDWITHMAEQKELQSQDGSVR